MMSVWGGASGLFAKGILYDYQWVAILDVVRSTLWCSCILMILKLSKHNRFTWIVAHGLTLCTAGGLILLIGLNAYFPHLDELGVKANKWFCVGQLVLSILGLAFVEQLYRNARPERRWGIKFLCIGVGGLFCFDLYMYANAVLFQQFDFVLWETRGAIGALLAPLILISAFRNYRWVGDLFPSRQTILHSTVFVSCGVYLLLMSGVGYYIREFGGNWGRAFQVIFFVGALLLLLTTLLSGKMQAWLKIFLSQHFFKLRYDYREQWLKFTRLLSVADQDQSLDERVIMALANVVESPSGALLEKTEGHQLTLKATWNNGHIKPFVVDDELWVKHLMTHKKVELVDKQPLTHWRSVLPKAWLVVPLIHENCLHGIVILDHPRVQYALNWEAPKLLETAGQQAAVCLVEKKTSEALAISKQFEGYNRLSAFILHDLKNVLAQVHLINENKNRHKDNPKFIESVFSTILETEKKLEKLIVQMRNPFPQQMMKRFDLSKTLKKAVSHHQCKSPKPSLNEAELTPIYLIGHEDKLFNAFCHLITNAQEACEPDDTISVTFKIVANVVKITIQDSGIGMSPTFIQEELFKPFVTTKGDKGMGIGMYQAKEYIQENQGKIEVSSQLNQGTHIYISFPLPNLSTNLEVA